MLNGSSGSELIEGPKDVFKSQRGASSLMYTDKRCMAETTSPEFERISCPKCASVESVVQFKGKDYLYQVPGDFFVSECSRCGFQFQNPRLTTERLVASYPTEYSPHAKHSSYSKEIVRWTSARFLRDQLGYKHLLDKPEEESNRRSLILPGFLRRWVAGVLLIPCYVPEGRILEIGCGSGRLLLSLRDLGWQQLHGIELVPAAAEQARTQGLEVECGQVEETLSRYPDQHFDVVICSMVLEHLGNPFKVVRVIAAKLKPEGQFLFSTVSRDSLDAKLYGAYWAGYDFPRHLVYFRKRDILEMLGDSFDHVVSFHQVAPIDCVRSSTWRRKNERQRLIDAIVLLLGDSLLTQAMSLPLAWLGLTSRVSFQCRRKK